MIFVLLYFSFSLLSYGKPRVSGGGQVDRDRTGKMSSRKISGKWASLQLGRGWRGQEELEESCRPMRLWHGMNQEPGMFYIKLQGIWAVRAVHIPVKGDTTPTPYLVYLVYPGSAMRFSSRVSCRPRKFHWDPSTAVTVTLLCLIHTDKEIGYMQLPNWTRVEKHGVKPG